MDLYTKKVRHWLNNRFEDFSDGTKYNDYFDYNRFSRENSEFYFYNHLILKRILSEKYASIIDLGGAEGFFTSLLARRKTGCSCFNFDLSTTAVKAGRESYELPALSGDIHDLPFKDGCVDFSFSSNVLEHVSEPAKAIAESLRITDKSALFIVPAKWKTNSKDYFCDPSGETAHRHINFFSENELMMHINKSGRRIRQVSFRGIGNKYFYFLTAFISGREISDRQRRKFASWQLFIYRMVRPFHKICGVRTIKLLVLLDPLMATIARKQTTHFYVKVDVE